MPNIALILSTAFSLLHLVTAHDDEESNMAGMDMMKHNMTGAKIITYEDQYELPNYFSLEAHSGMMLAHILFMVLAWFFILPIGVVFSIARSKLAIPVQLLFLALNGFGVVLGTVYNASTPDLYVKNVHHSIGWITTWVMTAQVVMSLLFVYAGRAKKVDEKQEERAAFLPASLRKIGERPYHKHRWSGDSGQGTEPPTARGSREVSSTDINRDQDPFEPEEESEDEYEHHVPQAKSSGLFDSVHQLLSLKVPQMISGNVLRIATIAYEIVDRMTLILGFIALTTGGVTYSGIFRSNNIFNGLAHFIKGGIFLWYGMLTLGRWMGCFSDLGWAWNVKPTRSEVGAWKASLPSAEFVESFVIFLYGITNVFLERLAAAKCAAWSPADMEHVSISIMFFGGGLCGMLVESKTIRPWLNTAVDRMPVRSEAHLSDAQDLRAEPVSYHSSMNVIPALIILLLGITMSSHHQASMTSTMVHKQWGTLLCGFSLARGMTYIIMWLSPPKSLYPSRPPTELISSFCLISGGIVFMASTKDIMHYLDAHNLMAMFIFTLTMGFTAFLMAYEILVLALKGWAIRREKKSLFKSMTSH